MTRVKICGIRTVEHGLAAASCGADFVGLIFAPSRRLVDDATAADISAAVKENHDTHVVGVFVNEDVEGINRRIKSVGLDYVQLSGDEPDSVIERINAPVIRVIHVHPEGPSDDLPERIERSPAPLILLDTARAGQYGGTGEPFDWSLLPATDREFLLAGGLTPDNVRAAVAIAGPWGVDVSSGVETDGVKDVQKIAAFIAAARSAHGAQSPR